MKFSFRLAKTRPQLRVLLGTLIFTLVAICSLKVTILPSSVDLLIRYEIHTVKKFFRQPILTKEPPNAIELSSYLNNIRKYRLAASSAVNDFNCKAIFANDTVEISRASHYATLTRRKKRSSSKSNQLMRIDELVNMTRDCDVFANGRGYIMTPLSQEEFDFPLAFSILVYRNVDQFERLLRTIYRPHNIYCIHVDLKTSEENFYAVQAIVDCFPNVFLASKRYEVYWGHISLLYAELSCMNDLLRFSWKYLINLSAQMFPLQSNKQIVKMLQNLNGTNDVEAIHDSGGLTTFAMRHMVSWHYSTIWNQLMPTLYAKDPPPFNLTLYKGSQQGAFSRQFVNFVINNEKARKFISWLSDTLIPDEHLWTTLNFNRHLEAPGSYQGNDEPYQRQFITRYSIWHPKSNQRTSSFECHGQWVRGICVLGVGDLYRLVDRPELFANKFFAEDDAVAYDCMEELVLNRTLNEITDTTELSKLISQIFHSVSLQEQ